MDTRMSGETKSCLFCILTAIVAITMIILSYNWSLHVEYLKAMENGYCQMQNVGRDGTIWMKCH